MSEQQKEQSEKPVSKNLPKMYNKRSVWLPQVKELTEGKKLERLRSGTDYIRDANGTLHRIGKKSKSIPK